MDSPIGMESLTIDGQAVGIDVAGSLERIATSDVEALRPFAETLLSELVRTRKWLLQERDAADAKLTEAVTS